MRCCTQVLTQFVHAHLGTEKSKLKRAQQMAKKVLVNGPLHSCLSRYRPSFRADVEDFSEKDVSDVIVIVISSLSSTGRSGMVTRINRLEACQGNMYGINVMRRRSGGDGLS